MSPQARYKLPPELDGLTRQGMETVIYQANLGRENSQIAQLYFVDKLPQVDVATELFLGRATVQRRLPEIMREMQRTSSKLYN
jgi:hypothetical protein|nr:MAG TPA: FocB protein-alpha, helix-turn-helix, TRANSCRIPTION.4A [Caudoviricetes sp.]